MADSLQRVTSQRSVIFGNGNNDAEFLGCLAHLLFMSSVKPDFHANSETIPGGYAFAVMLTALPKTADKWAAS